VCLTLDALKLSGNRPFECPSLACLLFSGFHSAKSCIVLPLATGMGLVFTLLTLREKRQQEVTQALQTCVNENREVLETVLEREKSSRRSQDKASSSEGYDIDKDIVQPASPTIVIWPRIDQKTCFKAIFTAGKIYNLLAFDNVDDS